MMRSKFIICSLLILAIVIGAGFYLNFRFFWLLVVILPIVSLGIYDMLQTKSSIVRNFPILGRTRFLAEWMRPKLYQYFVEPDTDGRPFPRTNRNIVYQRAKDVLDTAPFGTQLNVYNEGYEWMNHSIAPVNHHELDENPRTLVGARDCKKPYQASIFNISAMSYGSLSKNAVMAMNGGAKIGGFAHNTGEGGISPYHNKFGGDLIYQIGTGYFGCRSKDGGFDENLFKERTAPDNVKMIELKLSQGAKPGHGGILPAKKVTLEISKIRNVPMGKDVLSPPYHKAFSTPIGLMQFIKKMQDLSGGKPVGFKLCVGQKSEFISICKAMLETNIRPDFIAVDGGEGGTGAAPLEFADSVGMPFKEGLVFVYNALVGFGLKKEITLFAAGKIVSGFHIFRAIALGADATYSARAMMMAVGCIQALECNSNTCPTGVATQKEHLIKGLVVNDKKMRVANYHKETIIAFNEIMAAAGLRNSEEINRTHISKRISKYEVKRYDEIYPYIPEGCLLNKESIPKEWEKDMSISSANSFQAKFQEVFIEED